MATPDEPEYYQPEFDEPEPGDAESDESRPRRIRMMIILTVVGALMALVLGVGGIVLVNHELGKHATSSLVTKYEKKLTDCVHGGRSAAMCGPEIYIQCMLDPGWHNDKDPQAKCPGDPDG